MSIPTSVLQTVLKQLQGRMIVTFNTFTDTNFTAYPVACIFGTLQGFTCLPMSNPSAQSLVNNLIVYNQFYQRLETLDGSLCCFMPPVILGVGLAQMHKLSPSVDSNEQFSITSDGQVQYKDSTGVLTLYAYKVLDKPYLMFCSAGNTYCPNSSRNNLKLLNWYTLDDLQFQAAAVQDVVSLCCLTDDVSRVQAMFLWDKGPGSVQSVYPMYSSLQLCQQVGDPKCSCPTNNQCWMYNTTTVPCCIQGNPSWSSFQYDPAIVFLDKTSCVNAATKCSRWSFRSPDIPCCVQRSHDQWSDAGYSTDNLQLFDSQADCQAAASQAGTCTFQALLSPPTNLQDYYGLILESQYTSGCEPLRTAGNWGNSSSWNNGCAKDPNPTACYSGNCDNNYCGAWYAPTQTSYQFNQNVRCLPPRDMCCGSGEQVVTNSGKPSVSASCKN